MSSLLPYNSTDFERAAEAAMARLGDVPTPLHRLWNPDTCTEYELAILAWSLSIDNWSPDWPVAIRRARVRVAIDIQRRKGTAGAVRDAVASFGGAVTMREWFEQDPPGDPHTFILTMIVTDAIGTPTDAAFVDAIVDEVKRTKPVRSHFEFIQGVEAAGAIGLIGCARPFTFQRIACAA